MQKNIFNEHYVGSSDSSGITMPDTSKVANAYNIKTYIARTNKEMKDILPKILNYDGPALCELIISPEETISPRVKSIKLDNGKMESKPLEDMWPFLSEYEVKNNIKI